MGLVSSHSDGCTQFLPARAVSQRVDETILTPKASLDNASSCRAGKV